MHGCPKCGRILTEEVKICPYCHYNFDEINAFFIKDKTKTFLEDQKYAGLIKRLVAGLIDIYLVALITYALTYALKIEVTKQNILIIVTLFTVLYLFLNTIMERTKLRGSLGKYLVGIKVLDKEENPESIFVSFARNLAKILNIITFGLGFLICAGTKKKQTLGDLATKTCVVTDIKISDKDERQFSSPFKRLCAFILDIFLLALILYGINWLLLYFTGLNISDDLNIIINQITIPLNLLVGLLYFPLIESRKGTTFGKKILKIKTITLNDKKPGFFRLLFKQIILPIEIITLGFLLAVVTPKRQTLSNRLSKTVVVDM